MKVTRTAASTFTAELESEEELRAEHTTNLAHGALRLPTVEKVPLHTTLLVTLRGPWGGEAYAVTSPTTSPPSTRTSKPS